MNSKLIYIVSLIVLLLSGCTEKYIPEPNQVAFAKDLWQRTYINGDNEEWIPVYQLGTTDTDRDHYIRFHVDTSRTTGIEGKDFFFPEGDSLLIRKKTYLGYLKIVQLFEGEHYNPRVLIVLDGNESIVPKPGMRSCFVLF